MAITDAPNLRKADMQNCSSCQFFKWIDGADGACTKHEFSTEAEYVCDDYGLIVVEPLPDMESKSGMVSFGETVKAVKMEDGNVKLTGYLVRYGDATKTDLTGDFFTPNTDYGTIEKSEGWFNHRMPVRYGGKQFAYTEQLPDVKLTKDEVGIFAEMIIGARNEYEKMLAEMGLAGKLGWSSGTAPHLVDRKQVGNAWEITKWHLGLDASLTPTPAEPHNMVIPLKSLSVTQVTEAQAEQDKPERVVVPESNQNITGVKKMEIEETKLQEMLAQAAEAGATKAIAATEPVKSSGGTLQVVTDEGDREFKSLAEHARAVKDFTTSYGRKVDPRLARLIGAMKAVQGASEGNPADGGILLEPTLAGQVMQPVHEVGPFYAGASKIPAGENSNSGYILAVDETSRVTGSRWGGLRGYRLAEGDPFTKSKPKFRKVQWELKKYGVLVYGTDELLKDARQFSTIVEQGSREELAFMMNDDIYRGLGVSGAQGIMNSSALITVTRDTGSAIKGADISAMWSRLSLRSKARAAWYINPDCAAQLDSLFAVGSTAVLFPYAGYTAEGVRTLYGKPIIETEFNASLNTTGDILLADLSEYIVFEKGGIESASSIHVEFLTDQEVFRYIARMDGSANVASALTPANGSNTTSPFVVLGSAT
jgi:HK97 family phage major capsid protein